MPATQLFSTTLSQGLATCRFDFSIFPIFHLPKTEKIFQFYSYIARNLHRIFRYVDFCVTASFKKNFKFSRRIVRKLFIKFYLFIKTIQYIAKILSIFMESVIAVIQLKFQIICKICSRYGSGQFKNCSFEKACVKFSILRGLDQNSK